MISAVNNNVLGSLGVSFTLLFAATVSINRFVQLTVIQHSLPVPPADLARFLPYASDSVMFALEILGWGFFSSLAALCVAPLFSGMAKPIRGLFIAYGIFSLISVVGFATNTPIIASGGARETFIKLLEPGVLPPTFTQHVKEIPLMDSVFMLHLGLDYGYPEVLHCTSTYFYGTYDVEGQVKLAKQGIYHEGAAGFVVHLPSLRSPQMAPPGKHAMTIYTICPDKLAEGDWEQDKETYAEKLLQHAEKYLPGLRSHVLTRVIVTPADLRRITHLDHHAFGGTAPLLKAWKAPHETPVEGLWFIGAQSQSGGGMNAVIPAAWQVAKGVLVGCAGSR